MLATETENSHVLLTRFQGSALPENATVKTYTIKAALTDSASLQEPNKIQPAEGSMPFERDMVFEMGGYEVVVVEVVLVRL